MKRKVGPSIRDPIDIRFDQCVSPEPNTGCWLWMGHGDSRGYGSIRIANKSVKAHRYSYERYKGKIPKAMCILHKCDTPACVNPDHLRIGTNWDNRQDCMLKKRTAMGLNNGSAKLTAENLRLVMTSPLSNGALALKLGVSHTTVSKIRSGVYRSDETRKYQEVTTLKSEIAQLLEENERLALRVVEMREALKNLAANVKEMAEESFGHPDESFAFSFKENDPSGYFAWEAAEAALAAPPTEAEQRVKEWREALEYYANPFNWTSGDVADHIYAIDDSGRTAREALALRAAKEGSDAGK